MKENECTDCGAVIRPHPRQSVAYVRCGECQHRFDVLRYGCRAKIPDLDQRVERYAARHAAGLRIFD